MSETCGCGHLISDHAPDGPCTQWWRYPDVLDARKCGCLGVWQRRDRPAIATESPRSAEQAPEGVPVTPTHGENAGEGR